MYKKIIIGSTIIVIGILLYFAYNYYAVKYYKFASLQDYMPYYEAAASQFVTVGFIVSISYLLCTNIIIIKTKQLVWLWLPLVFALIYFAIVGYHIEHIHTLNKTIEDTKGNFSLGYLFGIIGAVLTVFAIIINYLLLKIYFTVQKNKSVS